MKHYLTLSLLLVVSMLSAQSVEIFEDPAQIQVFRSSNDLSAQLGYFGRDGSELRLYDESGNVETITLSGGQDQLPLGFLQIRGNINVRNINGESTVSIFGDIDQKGTGRVRTDQLEITGGADLAEYFEVDYTADIKPGNLVSMDPQNPGQLILSDKAYDPMVVGVISGANGVSTGMFMGQQGSIANGAYPIALTGRAYVKVIDENGAIEIGDFLTTSSTPGYAMRVKKMRKAQGAILGKAMSAADENGFVLTLINLQ